MATQDSRILIKRSTVAGVVPTVPSSNDHTDGTWLATDIYKGELYYNQADNILYTRSDAGIKVVSGNDCVCIKEASLTIASADVLQLNSTPLDIVAAKSGVIIDPIDATVTIDYGTTPYDTNVGLQLIQDNGGSFKPILSSLTVLNASTSVTRKLSIASSFAAGDSQLLVNTALQVYVPSGNPLNGDSDITVKVLYRELTP